MWQSKCKNVGADTFKEKAELERDLGVDLTSNPKAGLQQPSCRVKLDRDQTSWAHMCSAFFLSIYIKSLRYIYHLAYSEKYLHIRNLS